MDIITSNLLALLGNELYAHTHIISPLSPFKWHRLLAQADIHHVADYVHDAILNLLRKQPEVLEGTTLKDWNTDWYRMSVEHSAKYKPDENIFATRKQRMRYTDILSEHVEKRDTTPETMRLFRMLTANSMEMLNSGFCMRGLLQMGKFLREDGDKVDYVMLEQDLAMMGVTSLSSLQGSMLIQLFDFTEDEIPFLGDMKPSAGALALRCIVRPERYSSDEWSFRQGTHGLLANNPRQWVRGLRRTSLYFRYAPGDSVSTLFSRVVRSLSEIEE